jgi:hypothetical protein
VSPGHTFTSSYRVWDRLEESETIIIDVPKKPSPVLGGKRKRGGLVEDEL